MRSNPVSPAPKPDTVLLGHRGSEEEVRLTKSIIEEVSLTKSVIEDISLTKSIKSGRNGQECAKPGLLLGMAIGDVPIFRVLEEGLEGEGGGGGEEC